ncbi:hypothetical protein POG22_15860, partial [Geitlerinema sp. CS-897]|nr:hypothetical protein [Geitlerinema sp. CS-897]
GRGGERERGRKGEGEKGRGGEGEKLSTVSTVHCSLFTVHCKRLATVFTTVSNPYRTRLIDIVIYLSARFGIVY